MTPGPWVASQYLDDGRWGILRDPPADDVWDGGEIIVGVSSRLTSEDARLIAAAPDLLEALKVSRAQWIHSVNAEKCLAAIAKAEGETK